MRLGGPQGRSGEGQKISPPPGFDPRTIQPVASRYTDYATRPTKHVVISCLISQYRGRYSTGNTESSYKMDGPGFFEFWCRRGIVSSPENSKLVLGPLPRVNWYRNSLLGVKRVAHYFNHLASISTGVKKEWRYPSTSPTCLHGGQRTLCPFMAYRFNNSTKHERCGN